MSKNFPNIDFCYNRKSKINAIILIYFLGLNFCNEIIFLQARVPVCYILTMKKFAGNYQNHFHRYIL